MNFLYLNSKMMGTGDDILGEKLLISFLKTLAASEARIDFIGVVNGAVALTTQAGEALDALKTMEGRGTQIASCGTCLDFYEVRDMLLIGGVGSMQQTVEIMTQADRVIRPC
ncbi:MAG: sulfurtransferase-like selenium metabolism protein YedF [Candidatus Marinimicrobia bacterium]|nr:sulfurtransferase-like selenium metabolism protein YedF [Candidatus Neomarinimicrobiota bacterium]MCF7921234.1 sulfurtransferase-like selenium metabolism protein YedF [Candidatus Neomarinimicrobiota bacterium]